MPFRKSSPEMIERFEAALPAHPDVEPKKMFGYPAAWVNGNYFTGLFEETVLVRLPDAIKASVPELAGAPLFNPMQRGKGMTAFYVVPERLSRDVGPLAMLLERAYAVVRTLPPKPKKPKHVKRDASESRMTVPGTPAAKAAAKKAVPKKTSKASAPPPTKRRATKVVGPATKKPAAKTGSKRTKR